MGSGVEIRAMSKSFGGVTVVDRVDLDILAGEVHGLVGENGSGKSTVVKIIGGLYTPDEGSACTVWGEPLHFPVAQPQHHGIAIIHQDLALNDAMTVADNIGIASGYETRTLGLYRKRRERARAAELIADFGVRMDPGALVGGLTPSDRSMVAILRGLRLLRKHQEHQVLILDEPTAALTREESQRLIGMIRGIAARGAAVMFIGHRLQEVLTVCDRISVLRSGKLVGTVNAAESSDSEIVRLMLGYDIGAFYPERDEPDREREVLSVDHLSTATIQDVSFKAYRGEILGITGLAGMGQDNLPYLLVGHARRTAGQVSVNGSAVTPTVLGASAAGIALVPGNRQRDALWMSGTATENLTIPFVRRFTRHRLLRHKGEVTFAGEEMRRFGVRPLRPVQEMERFSGGNQQKIVLARWLHKNPQVLLLHEPTQGVDAGAKKELFELIRQAASSGTTVVIFSTDIEEIAHMCHRVLILRHGTFTAEIAQKQLSEERIMAESQGQNPSAVSAVPPPAPGQLTQEAPS